MYVIVCYSNVAQYFSRKFMACEMFLVIGQLSLRKFASKIDSKHKTEGPLGKRSLFFFINPNGSFRN
jgi:hypothetical protein